MKNFEEEVQNLLNLYKLKNLSAAEITANNLINKHPQNVWLYNILGLIFMEQKRFPKKKDQPKSNTPTKNIVKISIKEFENVPIHHTQIKHKTEIL